MKEYICLWKEMLTQGRLNSKYKERCTYCDGHDLICDAYIPNDECSALEGFIPSTISQNPLEKIIRKSVSDGRLKY